MGQPNPKESAIESYSLSSSFHDDHSQIGEYIDPEPNQGGSCMTMICRPRPKPEVNLWLLHSFLYFKIEPRVESIPAKET